VDLKLHEFKNPVYVFFSSGGDFMAVKKKRLGEMLVDDGWITEEQLEKALKLQKELGKKLGEVLLDEGLVTHEEILQVLENQLGIKSIDLNTIFIEPEVASMIPEKICRQYGVIGIEIANGQLIVAMSDPLDYYAIDDLRMAVPLPIKPIIAEKNKILNEIEKQFSKSAAESAVQDFVRSNITEKSETEKKLINEELENAPIVRFINAKIGDAIRRKASDIHIEPQRSSVKIRYRIDGVLQEDMRIDAGTMSAITSRIKIMSNLNIAEKRIPQDGRITYQHDSKIIDLRVSTLPTTYGEKIVLRILDKSSSILTKDSIGLSEEEQKVFDRIIEKPYGVVLVTGPTGSGKTTTLYTMLSSLNDDSKNTITLEDPVEFDIDGINQVQLNTKANLTFATGLRSILRQDPDIIMLGEIRDTETAEIAIRSALTGHLVLSTLHTNDAPSTITRIIDMGIDSFLVSSSLNGVISQRLVRQVCNNCKTEYIPDSRELKIIGLEEDSDIKLFKGKGCHLCGGTGLRGRIGIFEIMEVKREIRELIDKGASTDEIRDTAVDLGMHTLRQSCTKLVLEGKTTIGELIRVTYNY
jgi:type IV pilus assembly protein PilB